MLCVGLTLPATPGLLSSLLGNDAAAASRHYGALMALFSGMQLLFAPIIGSLSDRFGRRPAIFFSLLAGGLDYLLLATAPSLWLLYVGRIIAGIGGRSLTAVNAYAVDITAPEKRAQSFGLVMTAVGIGFTIGPVLGGVLASIDLRLPFVAAAGLGMINLLCGIFALPESLRPENRRPFSLRTSNPLSSFGRLGRNPTILGLSLTFFLIFMAQGIIQSVWALFTQYRFGWSYFEVGLSLTVGSLGFALVQGGVVRWVTPVLGERDAAIAALALGVLGNAAIGISNTGWQFYLSLIPCILAALVTPFIQALLTRQVEPSEQGGLQGALTGVKSIAFIVGPLLGSTLFSKFSKDDARFRVPGAPFFASAVLYAIAAFGLLWLFMRTRASDRAR